MTKKHFRLLAILVIAAASGLAETAARGAGCMVDAGGKGDFTTVQAALESIPKDNKERFVVEIRDGVYKEKVRIDANRVTLRGASRKGARLEFHQPNEGYNDSVDKLGRAVINIHGDDVIIENLTAENLVEEIGPHAFTIYGTGTRTIVQNCEVLSKGADTVSLWAHGGGMYYHRDCNITGSVDFVCPRGWCFIRDSSFYEWKATAAIWHDGAGEADKKFVLRNCAFDGTPQFKLGRRHHDGQFYLLDCKFSANMADQPIWRVTYPDNPSRDRPNLWGDRAYYYNCKRAGGADFAWHADNLSLAPGAPDPAAITPAWTFAGKWDPERNDPPALKKIDLSTDTVTLEFAEDVTVNGKPRVLCAGGGALEYASGSGGTRIVFSGTGAGDSLKIDLNGGEIFACLATSQPRKIPANSNLITR